MSTRRRRTTRTAALRRLSDRVLEASDLPGLIGILTGDLPRELHIDDATLLVWNRKLDSFEAVIPGETQTHTVRPGDPVPAPDAGFLLSDGQLIETRPEADGVLVPLMARSGLVGMLVLGTRRGRRHVPFRPTEAHVLSVLATRSALAIENHLYLRELLASERMAALGTMAGMLAHDFRSPMTVIRGYAETLADQEVEPKEVRKRARLIVSMIDRLDQMTTETLDFARGAGKLAPRTQAATAALGELLDMVAQEVSGVELVRDFRLPADLVCALDVDKLRRAVGNIVANARDAMGGRGRVHATAFEEPARDGTDRLVLILADEGPGVPAEIRDRVFEPFVTRGKKGGTGLGLAVSRRFVEDHGGTLELLSDGPGARFRIALPLAAPSTGDGAARPRTTATPA